jgi:type VI secretion system protein ImpG
MDDLLPEYERELALLRRSLREFAQRYPKAAARLGISGEHSEDPHVERLIQSAALQYARASVRLHDKLPELPIALLETLYPEYLRPFPSCAIAQFEGTHAIKKLTHPATIERGTELKTRTGGYPLLTVYDVTFAPLQIADARYAPTTSAPPGIRLPDDTSGIVSITFAARTAGASINQGMPKTVRVFVDCDRRTVAATLDTLMLRAKRAFSQAGPTGQWIALDAVPLSIPGFDDAEAIIEQQGSRRAQFRTLLEYFSFPQKFDFIDVNLAALLHGAGPCHSATLHIPISGLPYDCAPAVLLRGLSATSFKLFCTPVVNLYPSPAESIQLENVDLPVYPVVSGKLNSAKGSVYRIHEVRLLRETAKGAVTSVVDPYDSLSHHIAANNVAVYWRAERDGRLAEFLPGQDMLLSFIDASGQMVPAPGKQIDADLTCTNGNAPARLRIGDPAGDLLSGNDGLTGRVQLLRAPSESVVHDREGEALWDVAAMLSSHPVGLSQAGLPAFKRLLAAHLPSRLSIAMRHIDAITHLARESVLDWVVMEPQPMLVRGLRVRMAVDETALTDCAICVFARVLEYVLRRYASANSFIQLVLMSGRNGADLFCGKPIPGAAALI